MRKGCLSFESRVADFKKICEKKIQELVKLGYDPQKAEFNCRLSKKGTSVHIGFHPDFIKEIKANSHHGDIKKITEIFKKNNPDRKEGNLIINKKEVVIIGEEGLSLLIYILNRVFGIMKEKLIGEERRNLKRLKKDIRSSFAKVKTIDSVSVKTRFDNNNNSYHALIKIKKNPASYKSFTEKNNFFIPDTLSIEKKSISKIISEVNEYVRSVVKKENK